MRVIKETAVFDKPYVTKSASVTARKIRSPWYRLLPDDEAPYHDKGF